MGGQQGQSSFAAKSIRFDSLERAALPDWCCAKLIMKYFQHDCAILLELSKEYLFGPQDVLAKLASWEKFLIRSCCSMANPLKLFVSYSHKDQEQLDELVKYLRPLVDVGKVEPWTDRLIEIGTLWDAAIRQSLLSADIILLLVSSDFLNSEYISSNELVATKQRHEDKTAVVIPVLLSYCGYTNYWFSEIQGLPEGMVPLSDAEAKGKNEKSKAYTNVASKIQDLADELVKNRKLNRFEQLAKKLIQDSQDCEFSKADLDTLRDEQNELELTGQQVYEIKNHILKQCRKKIRITQGTLIPISITSKIMVSLCLSIVLNSSSDGKST